MDKGATPAITTETWGGKSKVSLNELSGILSDLLFAPGVEARAAYEPMMAQIMRLLSQQKRLELNRFSFDRTGQRALQEASIDLAALARKHQLPEKFAARFEPPGQRD